MSAEAAQQLLGLRQGARHDRDLAVIHALDALSLDDLNARAELQTRVDRKYVLPARDLPVVLADLDPRTLALEFPNGDRSSAYESVYFDTPELTSFHLAAYARRRRFKVRTRRYVDARVAFLEVKTRGGCSRTVKDRLELHQATAREFTREARDYAGTILDAAGIATPGGLGTMVPTLTTRYRRTTLLLPAEPGRNESRATIDRDLEWVDLGGPGEFAKRMRLPTTVIVETKSGSQPGALDRTLWRHGYRPAIISKYGTGLAALRPDLPRSRWHRVIATGIAPDADFSHA